MAFNCKAGITRGLKLLFLIAVMGLLQGCPPPPRPNPSPNPDSITDFTISGRSSRPDNCVDAAGQPRPCTAAETEALLFAEIGKEITVTIIGGTARCLTYTWVDFGDGTRVNPVNGIAKHTYTKWSGLKTIRLNNNDVSFTCRVLSKDIRVGFRPTDDDLKLGLCYGASHCATPITHQCETVGVAGLPPPTIIRKGSAVTITTNGLTIDYGPATSSTRFVFDASGSPTLPTPAGYDFPNRKKFSLVYQIVYPDLSGRHQPDLKVNFQGEAGPVTFTVPESGQLQVCTNDNPQYLADNVGHMMLTINVDERNAE